MSYNFPKIKLNKDGLFGPTTESHYYSPVSYHNKTAAPSKHKTTWKLRQSEQFEVFRVSDESKWFCKDKKGLFSILDNGEVVMGSNEERLSFFPTPVNANDSYHGYPIDSGEYEPSVELVDKWLEDKVIDDRLHIKILKGQI
ncbi:MAG: hypothetical protein RIE86_26880 [Imperialibacter sp.]|uniref:hypothetical protein n=1 Tax=Imperialibacter sp. TaxID=2038411 RepID=UPI0032EC4B69